MARVVVVGGGVVGTMHAREAVRRGFEVVQLERDLEPGKASVRNFGLLWVSGRASGEELAAALAAREHWARVAEEAPGVGLRPVGSLTVAQQLEELDVLEELAAQPDAGERGVELLDPALARRRNPALRGKLLGALWCRHDAVVEPRQVLGAVRAALAAGGRYRFLRARTVVEVGQGYARDHLGARHPGDLVLVCAGAAYDQVAGGHLAAAPVRRCRLQMLQTAPYPEPVTTALADGDSLRYYPAFRLPSADRLPPAPAIVADWGMQLLCVQRASGGLTIGDTHAYDEPFDFAVEEAPYDHLLERAASILGRRLPPVVRRWAGVYPVATDQRLAYRAQVEPGVVAVTGLGGRGMTLAPAVAERTFEELP